MRVDAVENYTRGLLASNADDKHRFFTQAARLDSHYSLPDFQLGRLLWSKKEYKSAAEWFQKVAPGDVHYHEANFFLGLCRYNSGDFAGAAAAFQAVARVVPLSEVYNNLAAAESRANRAPGVGGRFSQSVGRRPQRSGVPIQSGLRAVARGKFHRRGRTFSRSAWIMIPADAQAALLLERCEKQSGPRPGDSQTEGLERLKTNYEESAYWQLKAVLQPDKP